MPVNEALLRNPLKLESHAPHLVVDLLRNIGDSREVTYSSSGNYVFSQERPVAWIFAGLTRVINNLTERVNIDP